MSEEDKVPEDEIDLNEPVEQEDVQEEVKEKAKSTGHLTKDEYVSRGGKPEDYKTEKEYVLTGELIDLKKTVQKRDKDIEEIVKYHQNVVAAQKQSFRQQLEEQIQYARQTADVEKLEQLVKYKVQEDNRDEIKRQEIDQDDTRQALERFSSRNSHWFNQEHPELKSRAVEIEQEILSGEYAVKTGIPKPSNYDGVLKQVELAMKYEAPDIVPTQGTSRPVLSNTSSKINKSVNVESSETGMYSKLNSEQQAMYRSVRRMIEKMPGKPNYTVKEFLEKSKRDEEI